LRSPHEHVAMYSALIVGKLLADRRFPAACRAFLARTGLMSTLVEMLLEAPAAAAADASSSSPHPSQDGSVRRGIILHVLAAGACRTSRVRVCIVMRDAALSSALRHAVRPCVARPLRPCPRPSTLYLPKP
jgi:hypothetical protein